MVSLHETKGGCPAESWENGVIFGKINAIYTLTGYFVCKIPFSIDNRLVLVTHGLIDPGGCTVHSAVQHLCFCDACLMKGSV